MEYTNLTFLERVVLGTLPDATGAGRSTDKLHLTSVIRYIQERMGTGYKGQGFDDLTLAGDTGFIWEKVVERMTSDIAFSRHVWALKFESAWKSLQSIRTPEMVLDNIACSPDGKGPDPLGEYDEAVHEYKCTWKSSKTHPTENWYYMTQLKGYCKVIGTPCAVVQIIYLMGDYKYKGPKWLPTRIVFEQSEIDENWEMITNNAKYMEKDGG